MSDYLWDKTGEPDAEVARLESLLGGLRHRPRTLELPDEFASAEGTTHAPNRFAGHATPARRLFRPAWLAVAAALLVAFAAGVLLFLSARRMTGDERRVIKATPAPQTLPLTPTPATPAPTQEIARGPERREQQLVVSNTPPPVDVPTRERRSVVVRLPPTSTRLRPLTPPAPDSGGGNLTKASASVKDGAASDITTQQMAAKEQLVYALRLTSAKLREVRMKTMGADGAKSAFDERRPDR